MHGRQKLLQRLPQTIEARHKLLRQLCIEDKLKMRLALPSQRRSEVALMCLSIMHGLCEIVCAVSSVKYLYKYLEKGPDQCLVRLDIADETHEDLLCDEVTRFELERYITASEAYWRIYNFPIQLKEPPVRMLAIHLEDEQVITSLHPHM